PDGKRIAFTSNRDGNYEIYVMSADGTGQTRFTASAAADTTPDWQTVPIHPPPGTAVRSAVLSPRWHESEYRGRLVVTAAVPGAARIRLVLRRGNAVEFTTRMTLSSGSFARQFRLSRKLLPGRYVLTVVPSQSPTPLSPQTMAIALRAPPEGVVSQAWASDVV